MTNIGSIIGTCSICGGPVRKLSCEAPARCEKCGAMAAEHGPVIPMVPPQPIAQPYTPPIYTPPIVPIRYPWEFTWCGSASTHGARKYLPEMVAFNAERYGMSS